MRGCDKDAPLLFSCKGIDKIFMVSTKFDELPCRGESLSEERSDSGCLPSSVRSQLTRVTDILILRSLWQWSILLR